MYRYHLFSRSDDPKVMCAVPVDCPLPSFIRGPDWTFMQDRPLGILARVAERQSARSGSRRRSFYLFDAVDRDRPYGSLGGAAATLDEL